MEPEQGTNSEAWVKLAGLLDHGPVAVVWHDGRGCTRSDFDTVLERTESTITARTYQRGKECAEGGRVVPGRLCWVDTWSRKRSAVTHWPYLETMLDRIQGQQRMTPELGIEDVCQIRPLPQSVLDPVCR